MNVITTPAGNEKKAIAMYAPHVFYGQIQAQLKNYVVIILQSTMRHPQKEYASFSVYASNTLMIFHFGLTQIPVYAMAVSEIM